MGTPRGQRIPFIIQLHNIKETESFVGIAKYKITKENNNYKCVINSDHLYMVDYISINDTNLDSDTTIKINSKSIIIKNPDHFKLCIDVNYIFSLIYSNYPSITMKIDKRDLKILEYLQIYKSQIESVIIKYSEYSKNKKILELLLQNKKIDSIRMEYENDMYRIMNSDRIFKLVVAAYYRLSTIDSESDIRFLYDKSGFYIEEDIMLCWYYMNKLYTDKLKESIKND